MTDEPRKRIAKAIGAGSLGTAITILIRLVEVPVFLSYWSVGLYGEWLIISSLPTFLAMANVGIHSAAANEMTMRVAAGDRPSAIRTLHTAIAVLAVLSLVALAIAVVVGFALPLSQMLAFSQLGPRETGLLFVGLTVVVLVQMYVDLVWECYRACGIYHLGLLARNLLRLAEFVAMVAVILLGGGPLGVVGAMIGTLVLGGILGQRWLQRRYSWIQFGISQTSLRVVRDLWSAAFGFLLFPLAQAMLNQGLVFAIGRVISPAAVVVFVTVRTLCHLLQQVVGLIQRSYWPEFSIAFGRQDLSLARSLHRSACRGALWVTIVTAAGLGLFGPLVYQLWTRGKVELPLDLFWALLIVLSWRSIWETSSVAIIAINKNQRLAVVYLLAAGLALTSSFWLLDWFGLVGCVIAIGIFDLIMTIEVIPTSLQLVDDDLRGFLRSFFPVTAACRSVESTGVL